MPNTKPASEHIDRGSISSDHPRSKVACGIYAIRNIESGKKYIGSSVNISKRWNHHRSDLCAKQHHSIKLQRAWDRYGSEKFVFEVIEPVADKSQLITREQFWIDRELSYENGYNSMPVADRPLGLKQSKETIEKRVSKLIGRSPSEETREKIRAANKITHNTPEMKLRHSLQAIGRVCSDEQRAEMSAYRKGRPISKEALERRKTQNYFGRVASAETRKKLSEAKKNQSAETRKKISEARKGFKMTEEQKLKISLSKKAYHKAKGGAGGNV